jgi:hypothetical protein
MAPAELASQIDLPKRAIALVLAGGLLRRQVPHR